MRQTILILLFLLPTFAHAVTGYKAQPTQTNYTRPGPYSSDAAAMSAWVGYCYRDKYNSNYYTAGGYEYVASGHYRLNNLTRYPSSSACGTGAESWPYKHDTYITPVTCSTGYFDPDSGICTTAPNCTSGIKKTFNIPGATGTPTYVVSEQCRYVPSGVSLVFTTGPYAGWSGTATSNGDAWTGSGGEESGTPSSDGYCVTENGTELCLSGDAATELHAAGCTTVNGQLLCVGESGTVAAPPSAGNCKVLSGGAIACESTAATKPSDPIGNELPKGPSFDDSASGKTYDTYGNGTGTSSLPGAETGPACYPGEAGCPTKVDETGTPTSGSNDFAGNLAGTGVDEAISGLGTDAGSVSDSATSGVGEDHYLGNLPSGVACQTMQITILGHSVTIPSVSACATLAKVREIVAYVLWLATAWLMYMIAIPAPAARRA